MYQRNIFFGIVMGLFSLSGFILVLLQQWLHWIPNSGVFDKLRRALLSGFGFAISFVCGAVAIDFLGAPNLEKNWNIASLMSLICLSSPMIVLTMLGSFFWYLRRDSGN